ncbi:MAG: aminopeptidase P family protein [Thermoleophilaceae bacterium]|nr:aminopeptidase P family protein [Thermoleophilaceae bacterium]
MSVSAESAVEARTDRLVRLLDDRELDCLLVTNLVNVRYLTGFTGTNGACVLSREERLFLTDFRYVEQAGGQVRGYERVEAGRDMLGDLAKRLHGRAGFEDNHVTVEAHRKLGEKVAEGVELVPAGGLIEGLREVKDELELGAIRAAAAIADEAYGQLRARGLVGRTEREVALSLMRALEDRRAGPSFPAIVAGGEHGALPHATPRDAEIPANTLVVVDLGAQVDGYCSDCTRTFATGQLDDVALEAYELVRRAQEEALASVRGGASCPNVDAVARDIIEAAGHGEHFGHGLGHGVGLEVHEAPRLGKTAEGELRAGNVVTVEPGVYLPGAVGVRIEDLVVVTDGEPEVLTSCPKELVTVS